MSGLYLKSGEKFYTYVRTELQSSYTLRKVRQFSKIYHSRSIFTFVNTFFFFVLTFAPVVQCHLPNFLSKLGQQNEQRISVEIFVLKVHCCTVKDDENKVALLLNIIIYAQQDCSLNRLKSYLPNLENSRYVSCLT